MLEVVKCIDKRAQETLTSSIQTKHVNKTDTTTSAVSENKQTTKLLRLEKPYLAVSSGG